MRALAPLLRSALNNAPTGRIQLLDPSAKSLSTNAAAASEPTDDFAQRLFRKSDQGGMGFYRQLEKAQKVLHQRPPSSASVGGAGDSGSYNTLQDGMDQKLKNSAMAFRFDSVSGGGTSFANKQDPGGIQPNPSLYLRPFNDSKFCPWKQQRPYRPRPRYEFKVTTEEVLQKADFRNVRFLANFITEAGIIVKRSKTGISAKAQRKIAREIKTARAFGLLPFTTMGTKSFVFGQTMDEAESPVAKPPGYQ
ncbi:unnamed protein product [Linum tenue]|uniref:Small ribosomal subunit protein bS18c n=1 Tax=Linum tenue TaxID=586396 RepID=A0AAV0GMK1_9ROSI|nr:unnamed protein product [Linum tenue]